MTTISDWLRKHKFDVHVEAFEREGITLEMIHTLSDDDLKQLGMSKIGERRALQQAAAELRAASAQAATGARSSAVDALLEQFGGPSTPGRSADQAGAILLHDPMRKAVFGGAGIMLVSVLLPWLESRAGSSGFGQSFSVSGGSLIGLATTWGFLGAGLAAASVQQTRAGVRRAWMFGLASFGVVALQVYDASSSAISSSFGGATASAQLEPRFGLALFLLGTIVKTIGAFRLQGERTAAETMALRCMAGFVGLLSAIGLTHYSSILRVWFFGQAMNVQEPAGALWVLFNVLGPLGIVWAAMNVRPDIGIRLRAQWHAERDALSPAAWQELAGWVVATPLMRGMVAWGLASLLTWASMRFDVPSLTRALMGVEWAVPVVVLGLLARTLYSTFGLRIAAVLPAYPAVAGAYIVIDRLFSEPSISIAARPDPVGILLYSMPVAIAIGFLMWAFRRVQARSPQAPELDALRASWLRAGPAVMAVPFSALVNSTFTGAHLMGVIVFASWSLFAVIAWVHTMYEQRLRPDVETMVVGAASIMACMMLMPSEASWGDINAGGPVLATLGASLAFALGTSRRERVQGWIAAVVLPALVLLAPQIPFGSVSITGVVIRRSVPAGEVIELLQPSLEGGVVEVSGKQLSLTEDRIRVPAGNRAWTIHHPLADGPVSVRVTPEPEEPVALEMPISKAYVVVRYTGVDGREVDYSATTTPKAPWLLDGTPLADLTQDEQGRFIVPAGTHVISIQDPDWSGGEATFDAPAGETSWPKLGSVRQLPKAGPVSVPTPTDVAISVDSAAMGAGAASAMMPSNVAPTSTTAPASLQTPSWIVSVGAFPDAAAADAFIAKVAREGHAGLSKLWIPDYASLSGKPLFVVFDGPFPYADRETARQRAVAAQAWSKGAYAVKIDRTPGREEIRP